MIEVESVPVHHIALIGELLGYEVSQDEVNKTAVLCTASTYVMFICKFLLLLLIS